MGFLIMVKLNPFRKTQDPGNQEAVATAHVLFELLKLSKEVRNVEFGA